MMVAYNSGWLQKVVAFKSHKANVNRSKRHMVTPTQVFFGLHAHEASGGPL